MTVVTRSPGAVGSGPWTNFTVESLQYWDDNYASVSLDSQNNVLQQATSAFGFAIPADATITALAVEGRCGFADAISAPRTLYLEMHLGVPLFGLASLELAADEGAGWTIIQGAADPNLPTVAQLNSPDFTVLVETWRGAGENALAVLDYITLTVEYDEYVPPPPPEPDAPGVSTSVPWAISAFAAACGGNIYSTGGAAITGHGICVSTEPNPRESSYWAAGGGLGTFAFDIASLAAGTRYYVAAYATNSAGTGFGADQTFVTHGVPTVSTLTVHDIAITTAVSGGNVTDDGGEAIIARGIAWGTSPCPRTGYTSDGGTTGEVTGWLTGLTPGTRYFVAAYAQNAAGWAWAADQSFVTHGPPTVATAGAYDIDATTATSGGNVASDGGEAVTARGVCWSVAENPTTANSHTTDGSGLGAFVSALTGLTEGLTYNVRAYAVNLAGTAYGAAVTFTAIENEPPVEPPPGPPRDPSENLLFDGTLELMVGTLDVAGSATQVKYSNSNPGGFGGLSFRLPLGHATGDNLIPAMTSATTPSGVATSSGDYSSTYAKWKAFDHLNGATNSWMGPTGTTGYIGYQFPAAHVVTRYAVTSRNVAWSGAPKTWTFEGSNNGSTWVTLDAQTDITSWAATPNVRKVFDFVNTTAYAYYRLDITASNGSYVGIGELEMMESVLAVASPWEPFDAQVVKGAAVTMKHGMVGFVATLFEGEVTSDVSHATIAGGKAYYDVTCAGLWWKAGQRKDFSMVIGDDDYGQWFTMDNNAKAFQVSTDGKLEIRLAAGQSAAAGDSASLYYWLGKGLGDPAASIDFLFGINTLNVVGANWFAEVWSAPNPWGPWTLCDRATNGADTWTSCYAAAGDTPQALRIKLYTTSAVDALPEDRFVRLDQMSVGSGVSANALSAVSVANPTVVTSTSAHGLKTGDRVFIMQTAASTPTISGWRTVTVTDGGHFAVPVNVTTAGGAGTFYKATRIDQALVEIAVTTGLATLASLQSGGIGNLNWGLLVRPHASRAGGIDLLAATNIAPFDYGFWDNSTFYCQDRPLAIRALHDYLIDSSLPGIDFDVRRATEDSPTVVKVLYKFRAEDGETGGCPDGTALAVYRDIDPATGLGRTYAGDWSDASVVLDVWTEWADLSLTTAQAGDLGDQILAWLSANAYQGGGSIAPATLPLRAEGTKPTAYIRGGDYIEDVNLDTGPLMITGFSMDADRGIGSIGIGENRRAFVERLTPDKA